MEAASSSVPLKTSACRVLMIRCAKAENHSRSWLEANQWVLVRSAKRSICCSLMRFSMSPRAQIKLLVQCGWFEASRLDRITPSVLGQVGHDKARIYRPWVKSRLFQFPITRRALVQLLRVEYSNSVKLRQGVSTFAF